MSGTSKLGRYVVINARGVPLSSSDNRKQADQQAKQNGGMVVPRGQLKKVQQQHAEAERSFREAQEHNRQPKQDKLC